MGRKIDLKFKFNEYFMTPEGFSFRAERFYDDVETQRFAQDATLMVKWLEAAFIEGCRTMAQDTLDTLGDYATSVAGINELVYNRTQAFDAARENLMVYYTQILSDVENKHD